MIKFNPTDLLNVLGKYPVGFVRPEMERPGYYLIGSGTLIKIDGMSGVLTAARVMDEIPTRGIAALTLFKNLDIGQFVEIDMALTDRIILPGADLAFVRLPLPIVGTLAASKPFKDISAPPAPREDGIVLHARFGVPGKWTPDEELSDRTRRRFKLMGTMGKASDDRDVGACDLFTFAPILAEQFAALSSYGGVSGGGVWEVYINAEGEVLERRLVGVTFEEREVERSLVIDCYGPLSIYDLLANEIRESQAVRL